MYIIIIAQLVVWCSLVTADKVLTWVSRFEGVLLEQVQKVEKYAFLLLLSFFLSFSSFFWGGGGRGGGWGGGWGWGLKGSRGWVGEMMRMGWRLSLFLLCSRLSLFVSALSEVIFIFFCFVRGYLCLFLLCSRLPLFVSALF